MKFIDRRQPGIGRALLRGASLIALASAAPLHSRQAAPTTGAAPRADGIVENRYFMMMMTQTFDGMKERSHSQKAGFARLRNGDESWINIDYGDGAMVIVDPGRMSVGRFLNTTPTEIALAYDYRTHSLRGNAATSGHHNRYVRPLLGKAPPLGNDADWAIEVTPELLGASGANGGKLTIALKRRYFSHGGSDYVLIDYSVPAFSYRNAAGETIVHWARGVALADPGFGQIYWNAALQRAVAQPARGDARPYRFARSIVSVDKAGKPLIDPADLARLKPFVEEFYSKEATAPIPRVPTEGEPDQTPLRLAALLDVAALSIAENSANQLGEAVGSYVFGETGSNTGSVVDQTVLGIRRDVAPYIDASVEGFSVPDKILAVMGGIANLGPGPVNEEAFIRRTGVTFAEIEGLSKHVDALTKNTAALRGEIQTIKNSYPAVVQLAKDLRAAAGRLDAPLGGTHITLARAQEAERRAAAMLKRITQLDAELKVNVSIGIKISRALPALEKLKAVAEGAGVVKFARSLGQALEKYKLAPVFTVLGTIGNINTIATAGSNLRDFDPSNPDLHLQGSYDTTGGLVGKITLDALGMAGNIASGNIVAAVFDIATVATGNFTDLYMAMEAARHTEGDVKLAHMQHMLTLMKKVKLDREHIEKFQADVDALGVKIAALKQELASRPPSNVSSDDWRDPRFDESTGLPIPDYWAWLKENQPETLRAMGIDPDAPVGGWPGGARPSMPAPAPAEVAQPRQPGGPDYPTARPRPGEASAEADDAAGAAAGGAGPAEEGPGSAAETAAAESAAAEAGATDAGTVAGQEAADAAEAANQIGGATAGEIAEAAAGAMGPDWAGDAPAELGVSPLEVSPLGFEPVTFTPVTFEPVTFEPVTWEPPQWVPPEFDAPEPMELPWPDFGDDQYDFGGDPDNLAFDYADMSGKVATDLSKWAKWLKTQNVRELERLALAAGYPNLASALNDAENLIRKARDQGFRQWAFAMPAFSGSIGLWASAAQHDLARAQVLLGDILGQSREIFSTGGFSDIGISGLDLAYVLRDFGLQDGDIVDIDLEQFGRTIFTTRLTLLNDGTNLVQALRPGVAKLVITAVNEGSASPNTAEINIKNVVRGEADQSYSLNTGQTAVLRVESNAKKGK